MKSILATVALLAGLGLSAPAATISFIAPASANGLFDILIQSSNLFAGRDSSTDGIISYGFDVGIGNPLLVTFNGATSGPLFDPALTEPGTDVFGSASGFGVFAPVSEPLTLATLHFTRIAAGDIDITISSDLSNPFQGLQFLNAPFAQSIGGRISVADATTATPEPGTLAITSIGFVCLVALLRKPPFTAPPRR